MSAPSPAPVPATLQRTSATSYATNGDETHIIGYFYHDQVTHDRVLH
ncbi:hypothetical protein A1F99_047030 [Pyrenophora tritici-repentis]|nr:hypothetical protein A1F99_047030 [Pyrenophora tritici-repentis]